MKLQNSFRDYTAESALFVRRALVAFLGILLLTGVLIANLYNLQIVRFTDYQTRSNENRIKLVPIAPSRGIIYDRNGIPLALNRTIYQIEMMPEKVVKPSSSATSRASGVIMLARRTTDIACSPRACASRISFAVMSFFTCFLLFGERCQIIHQLLHALRVVAV